MRHYNHELEKAPIKSHFRQTDSIGLSFLLGCSGVFLSSLRKTPSRGETEQPFFYIERGIMGKDPAFLFYPNDYLGGTMGWTFEQKGAYMELLMMQFNRGHMTSHMIGQTVGQLWAQVEDKFIQDDKGKWYNERLEFEQKKRSDYTATRNNNLKGTNQHTKRGHMDGQLTSHMENRNRDRNESGIRDGDNNIIYNKVSKENKEKLKEMMDKTAKDMTVLDCPKGKK